MLLSHNWSEPDFRSPIGIPDAVCATRVANSALKLYIRTLRDNGCGPMFTEAVVIPQKQNSCRFRFMFQKYTWITWSNRRFDHASPPPNSTGRRGYLPIHLIPQTLHNSYSNKSSHRMQRWHEMPFGLINVCVDYIYYIFLNAGFLFTVHFS